MEVLLVWKNLEIFPDGLTMNLPVILGNVYHVFSIKMEKWFLQEIILIILNKMKKLGNTSPIK